MSDGDLETFLAFASPEQPTIEEKPVAAGEQSGGALPELHDEGAGTR